MSAVHRAGASTRGARLRTRPMTNCRLKCRCLNPAMSTRASGSAFARSNRASRSSSKFSRQCRWAPSKRHSAGRNPVRAWDSPRLSAVTCWLGSGSTEMAGLHVAICAMRRGSNGPCWKSQSKEISSPTFRSVTSRSTVLTRDTTYKMRKILFEGLVQGSLTERPPAPDEAALAELAESVNEESRTRLGRSLSIRQVDAGSCNGCELEIHALNNAFYDLERFGLRFVASPRHADVLLVTGPVTKNMREALERTWAATPDPKWVVAAGDCARGCGVFAGSYAVTGGVSEVVPVDLHIPGCPPTPTALLKGLLALLECSDRSRA